MATTLKLKADIKKLKAAIDRKGTPANILPKLKAQLEKVENELASMKKGASPRKVSTTKGTTSTLSKLQKMVQSKKYSVYQGSSVDLQKDSDEGAMHTGRRTSKGLKANQYGTAKQNKGNVYYEYRPNRLDVKQPKAKQTYPKLADGGETNSRIKLYYHETSGGAEYLTSEKVEGSKKEGSLDARYIIRIDGASDHGGELILAEGSLRDRHKLYYHETSGGAEYLTSEKVKGSKKEGTFQSQYIVRIDGASDHGGELIIKNQYASGGYMAKGGKTKDEPKVIRGFSDDEAYEYAQGGAVEHGLMVGDKILKKMGNAITVENDGKKYVVNLNQGERVSMENFIQMDSRDSYGHVYFSEGGKLGKVGSKTHRYDK